MECVVASFIAKICPLNIIFVAGKLTKWESYELDAANLRSLEYKGILHILKKQEEKCRILIKQCCALRNELNPRKMKLH